MHELRCAHNRRRLWAIYRLSNGVPRLALKVASNALHLAAALDVPIDERVVNKANKISIWRRIFGSRE